MVTGGFKTRNEAAHAISTGAADMVGLARTMALDHELATKWLHVDGGDPDFPSFASPPPGGITAWFTMRLTAIANGDEAGFGPTLSEAVEMYDLRDAERVAKWQAAFGLR